MEYLKRSSRLIPAFTLTVSLALFTGSAAAGICKGVEKSACSTDEMCSWVESYARSDGAKVRGYCRTKSSGKQKAKRAVESSGSEQKEKS